MRAEDRDSDRWTYAKSGVDIKREEEVVKALSRSLKRKKEIEKGYANLLELPFEKEHLIAVSCDGVGSKIIIAAETNKWDTIGIDCIAMNVNDIYCVGAKPISFVDYLAMQNPNEWIAAEIGKGLEEGANIAGIYVAGGETAILPEVVNSFDLSGMCVGYVRKDKVIRGEKTEEGDLIIGMESSGIHSNGLTLARKVIKEAGFSFEDSFPYNSKKSIGEELLTPTRIYTEVLHLIEKCEVHGLAHITGGGLSKLKRIINHKLSLGFDIYDPFEPKEVFKFIQEAGNIEDEEMFKTFNMGIGFVAVIPRNEEKKAIRITRGKIVGEVTKKRGIKVKGIRML